MKQMKQVKQVKRFAPCGRPVELAKSCFNWFSCNRLALLSLSFYSMGGDRGVRNGVRIGLPLINSIVLLRCDGIIRSILLLTSEQAN